MLQKLRKIFSHSFTPLNTITVSQEAILSNIEYLSGLHKGSEVFPVIKSNAYGHGLPQMCEILNHSNIHTVCIDSLYEYQIVKKFFQGNIIMLGETHPENYLGLETKKVAASIYNISTLKYLADSGKKFRVHIFLNTGMNREGIQDSQIQDFCDIILSSNLILEGLVSHFSSADDESLDITQRQIEKFKTMAEQVKSYGFEPKYSYISASGGTLRVEDSYFNAIKPGLACYGYNPIAKKHDLQPALNVYSTITSIQEVGVEDGVGYNYTYSSTEQTRVASFPFGYCEGLDRRLSNNWQVKIGEKYYPVRGRISMNICTIEIGNDDIAIGDRVQVISSNPNHKNSISAMADTTGTIDYEILVKLNPSVRREIIEQNTQGEQG